MEGHGGVTGAVVNHSKRAAKVALGLIVKKAAAVLVGSFSIVAPIILVIMIVLYVLLTIFAPDVPNNETMEIGLVGEISNEVKYADYINAAVAKYATEYGPDAALVAAVIRAESGFDPTVVSTAGAVGAMQVLPSNAKGADLTDPEQNIMRGTQILASHLKRYQGDIDKSLAAYNAGPGNVQKFGGVPPFAETTSYIKKVKRYYEYYKTKLENGKLVIHAGKFTNPAPGATVTSKYGPRSDGFHGGQDFAGPVGTPILAAGDGVVTKVEHLGDRSYGSYVVIDHGNGISTLYAHMWPDQVKVKAGQKVKTGQVIGGIGNNGNSIGPHLHFEVRKNGNWVNPAPYLGG